MKADAWKEYQKAAKVSMWLEAIPSIAAEVAAPLSQVRWIPKNTTKNNLSTILVILKNESSTFFSNISEQKKRLIWGAKYFL